jgi:hypothetical protein
MAVFLKVYAKRIAARCIAIVAVAVALYVPASITAPQTDTKKVTLDYEFFKTRVEPIYLRSRSPAHARCITCHVKAKHPRGMSLEPLSPGSESWTEEQSRKNFLTVSKLVVPGKVDVSMFPMHPLAPEAGGDIHAHSGGRQFESQDDPDFKTIVEWIRGEKAEGYSAP